MSVGFNRIAAVLGALTLAGFVVVLSPPAELQASEPATSPASFELAVVNGIGPTEEAAAVALMHQAIADPFQAQFCGGTAVTATAVLTAAHCVDDLQPRHLEVFVGSADLYSRDGARVPVSRIDVHPRWESGGDFDIAVVHLSGAHAPDTLHMIPPGWQTFRDVPPSPGDLTNAFAVGWGCTSVNLEDGSCTSFPSVLQGARIELVDASTCDFLAELVLEHGNAYGLLCAGGLSDFGGTPDTCQGDSGGPLTYPGARGFSVLVGVTSWGVGCGYLPGVYTHIAAHHQWIFRQLATSPAAQQQVSFSDVSAASTHAQGIMSVASMGIAGGFTDETFGPSLHVTRGQMATFLARSLHLPRDQWYDSNYGGVDVQRADSHAQGIAGVVTASIASGYPDGTYRPDEPVTRGQMATFLTRAFQLEAGDQPIPADVANDSTHARGITAVLAEGVATGFPDGNFGPDEPVTRGQMATFLDRALQTPSSP